MKKIMCGSRSGFGLKASSIFHERVELFPGNTHLRNKFHVSTSDNRTYNQ